MGWFDTLKAPPIYNPMPAADEARALEIHPNNKMKPSEAKTFFEASIDPYLRYAAEHNEAIVTIPLDRLQMDGQVAMKLISNLYPVEDYKDIWVDSSKEGIIFDMGQGSGNTKPTPTKNLKSIWNQNE